MKTTFTTQKTTSWHVPTPANPEPVSPSKGSLFKPKRAGKNDVPTHVVFILDSSSSMISMHGETVSGYNEFLDTQRKEAEDSGIDTVISLYVFNGTTTTNIIDHKNVKEVEPLSPSEYRPSGMTNLYDAIGNVMFNINHEFKKVSKADRESVIVTILTDGQENASKEFSSADVKAMVEKAEAKGWGFMFLGANIDAFAVGSAFGMRKENTIQYTTNNMSETIAYASASTNMIKSGMRSGESLDTVYARAINDEDRAKLNK